MKRKLFIFSVAVAFLYLLAILWLYTWRYQLAFDYNGMVNEKGQRYITTDSLPKGFIKFLLNYRNDSLVGCKYTTTIDHDVWVLYCHGADGDLTMNHHPKRYELLHNTNISILTFDYKGYGETQGKPSEKQMFKDAETAYQHLHEREYIPAEKIVIYGEGIGAAIALHLANKYTCAGVIIEGGVTSLPDLMQQAYPIVPARYIMKKIQFNALEEIKRLQKPLLVIHAIDDGKVPIIHGKRLYEQAKTPHKNFVSLKGKHHTAPLENPQAYQRAISDFLKAVGLRKI